MNSINSINMTGRTQKSPNFCGIRFESDEAYNSLSKSDRRVLLKNFDDIFATEYSDIFVSNNGKREIHAKNDNFDPLNYCCDTVDISYESERSDLKVHGKWGGHGTSFIKHGDEYDSYWTFEDSDAAKFAFDDINSSDGLEKDIKLLLYLDKAQRYLKQLYANNKQEANIKAMEEVRTRLQDEV